MCINFQQKALKSLGYKNINEFQKIVSYTQLDPIKT